jgi:2-keto-4-pentenoate hydratase/2-oxohepta-3-ene-1,7-dioic acid hydratase in catechol pathway
MKLALYDDYRPALLTDSGIIDISADVPIGRNGQETMEGVIANWADLQPVLARHLAENNTTPLESVRLRAPLPKPGKVMCMAANYRENLSIDPLPINGFLVSPEAVMGPGGTTVLPAYNFSICHHEAELVVVIGKRGKSVPQSEAMNYIFGYTAGVDVSARGAWGWLSKAYDGFKPIGPCIVTADEITEPHDLRIRLAVDGQPRQDYNTSDIGHRIPECIEYFSAIMTLMPGDLLFLGTNHQGLGPLQDGEDVEMEIQDIGSFHFGISDPSKRSWPKSVDGTVGEHVRQMLRDNAQKVAAAS